MTNPSGTMAKRLRIYFFILTVVFYIPVCLSVPASTLGSWVANLQENPDHPICGCEDASCCCGAPCCAPKDSADTASSCCDSTEPEQHSAENIPLSIQIAWQASCTCGANHAADGTHLADPQNLVFCHGSTFWLPAFSLNTSYVRHWTSLAPSAPEQIPKPFLFS